MRESVTNFIFKKRHLFTMYINECQVAHAGTGRDRYIKQGWII